MMRRLSHLLSSFFRSSLFFWFMVVCGLLLALLGPRYVFAHPVVLQDRGDWQAAWSALDERRDVAHRSWRVADSFTIREDFRISGGASDWFIDPGQTLQLANRLLNDPGEPGVLRKYGGGHLVLSAEGSMRGGLELLQGSMHVAGGEMAQASGLDLFAHANTRLSYADGLQVGGQLHVYSRRDDCLLVSCPPVADYPGYADGLQWVVAQGTAVQRGLVHNLHIPVYKLGAGVLQLSGPFVGSGLNAPVHVEQGALELAATQLAAPVTVYGGAGLWARGSSWVRSVYVRPGGQLQVGKDTGGPGLKVGLDLYLDASSRLLLERGAQQADEPVLLTEAGAQVRLDGELLVGLQPGDWDPEQRYALMQMDGSYEGRFADYEVQGALPDGYEGVLDYEEGGLWLAFQRALAKRSRPVEHHYHELHRSLALASHYFPESVRQHYAAQGQLPAGLSGWAWHGGAHQRSHDRLRNQMSYFGLNWQAEQFAEPVNVGLQFGLEHGHWQKQSSRSHINSWVVGISAEQKRDSGLHWLVGAAHHRYALDGQREQASHRYHARLNQLYGQLYQQFSGRRTTQAGRHEWQLGPVLQLRLMQLRTPALRESGMEALSLPARRYHYADVGLGLQGGWEISAGEKRAHITHQLSYHRWLGSRPRPGGHISAQLGLDLQTNQHWRFGLNTQTRLGKGLRDQAINFNIAAIF